MSVEFNGRDGERVDTLDYYMGLERAVPAIRCGWPDCRSTRVQEDVTQRELHCEDCSRTTSYRVAVEQRERDHPLFGAMGRAFR